MLFKKIAERLLVKKISFSRVTKMPAAHGDKKKKEQ